MAAGRTPPTGRAGTRPMGGRGTIEAILPREGGALVREHQRAGPAAPPTRWVTGAAYRPAVDRGGGTGTLVWVTPWSVLRATP